MANKERGEVDLVAGGTTYTLRLSINALAEVEQMMGLGIDEILAVLRKPKGGLRLTTWRGILWGALREFHKCTPDEAGEIMGVAGVPETVAKLNEAMAVAFPDGDGANAENPPKASHGAGSGS